MSIDSDLVKLLADSLSDDPDAIDETVFKNMAKKTSKRAPAPRTPNIGMLSESNDNAYTHKCRNKVYRRGIVMACGKACYSVHCEGCKPSRAATSKKMLGETSKKKSSNIPDMLDVEKGFDTHDGHEEKRSKSSLSDLEGEEGSSSRPYLEDRLAEGEMEWDFGEDDEDDGTWPEASWETRDREEKERGELRNDGSDAGPRKPFKFKSKRRKKLDKRDEEARRARTAEDKPDDDWPKASWE